MHKPPVMQEDPHQAARSRPPKCHAQWWLKTGAVLSGGLKQVPCSAATAQFLEVLGLCAEHTERLVIQRGC